MTSIFESLENLNVSEECFDDIMGIVEELLNEGYNLHDTVRKVQARAYDEMQKNKGIKNPQYKILPKLKELTKKYAKRTGVEDVQNLGDNLERAAIKQKSDTDSYAAGSDAIESGANVSRGRTKNEKGEWKTDIRRIKNKEK